MIKVPLTRGYTAIIDDEDAHLADMRWFASAGKYGPIYAVGNSPSVGGKRHQLLLHREVLGLQRGDGKVVDHINGDSLDCRRANLRVVTNKENGWNRRGAQIGAATKFLGVNQRGYRWEARIMAGGKNQHLGSFRTAEQANVARLKAELELWGVQPRRQKAFQEAGIST